MLAVRSDRAATTIAVEWLRTDEADLFERQLAMQLLGTLRSPAANERDRKYLLRSVVDPSADIEPKYLSRTFLMASGEVVQGVVQSETEEEIVLVDNRGQEVRVLQEEIEDEREQRASIMPTMTDLMTPQEIRDVVAFLSPLK